MYITAKTLFIVISVVINLSSKYTANYLKHKITKINMDHVYLDRSNALYEDLSDKEFVIIGIPFDSTETSLPGQRLAPNKIREILKFKDTERLWDDVGNVVVVPGNARKTLERVEEVLEEIDFNKLVVLGGEHTITYAPVKYFKSKHKELQVVVFDAHYDLKDNYEGELFNHSTIMRRIKELGVELFYKGVRRYDDEEENYASKHVEDAPKLKRIPTYITIDLDYFDLPLAMGCADKESNGFTYKDFIDEIDAILNRVGKDNIVGFDIVELNPLLDVSGVTTSLAADILIEISRKLK